MRVGFVGLGSKGCSIAVPMAADDGGLGVWSGDPKFDEARTRLRSVPELVFDSLDAMAARSNLVGTCLDDEILEELLGGVLEGMAPGSVVANFESGAPGVSARLAQLGRRYEVSVLDAPLSGPPGSLNRKWQTMMVGGARDALWRCRRELDAVAEQVHHVGGSGLGQLAKMINNSLFAANLKHAGDALALGNSLGIDPRSLREVLLASSGDSYALGALGGQITRETAVHLLATLNRQVAELGAARRAAGLSSSPLEATAVAGAAGVAGAVAAAAGAGERSSSGR